MNRNRLIKKLKNKPYREAFVASRMRQDAAFQIRLMREAKQWTQEELASRMGVSQARIAQLEDPSYGRYSSRTFKRLASVFDVGFMQRFVSFSNLVDWTTTLSQSALCPKAFDEEGIFIQESLEAKPEQSTAAGDSSIRNSTNENNIVMFPDRSDQHLAQDERNTATQVNA